MAEALKKMLPREGREGWERQTQEERTVNFQNKGQHAIERTTSGMIRDFKLCRGQNKITAHQGQSWGHNCEDDRV